MKKILLIGSGAASLACAHYLKGNFHVSLFEKNDHFGGHCHTHTLKTSIDSGLKLDLGFMVMNSTNYNQLQQLLSDVGINSYGKSEMSFSYYNPVNHFNYAINWQADNYFAKKYNQSEKNLKRSMILPYLSDISKGCQEIISDLNNSALKNVSLRDYFFEKNFSKEFINYYLLPMGSAIWSTPCKHMLDFSALNFFHFFYNHGLLDFKTKIQWQYIKGGSQTYVEKIVEKISNPRLNTGVSRVQRLNTGVAVYLTNGNEYYFDLVVIATHADQALKLLAKPSSLEKILLSSWQYARNDAVLHTDTAVMPPDSGSWASWNSVLEDASEHRFSLNYHLNRLQGHTQTEKQYFLSLNRRLLIEDAKIIYKATFTHPMYTTVSFTAQKRLNEINGVDHIYYCGSYFGYGFHEDAIKSGKQTAELINRHYHV